MQHAGDKWKSFAQMNCRFRWIAIFLKERLIADWNLLCLEQCIFPHWNKEQYYVF